MDSTRLARPGALVRLSACGLLVAGALVVPATASAAPAVEAPAPVSARTVPAATSTVLTEQVTDDADVLDDAAARDVVNQLAAEGIGLWVVTIDDASMTAEEYAAKAWDDSRLGTQDLLLVINMTSSGRTYAFSGSAKNSVWSDSTTDAVRTKIYNELKDGDYDGAVAAVLTGLDSSAGTGDSSGSGTSGGTGVALVLGTTALVGGGAVLYSRSRRKKSLEGPAGARAASVVPLETLALQAGNALVTADDAVRAADEELSYAQAQFGLAATDSFTQALATAREHVARSFELRKLLDDDIPETEAQQRQMNSEILGRCQDAVRVIQEQEAAFSERRGLEANLPASISETGQRADETERAITAAQTLLVTLHASYPSSALTSVSEAPTQAQRLLAAGRTALDQARDSLASGEQSTAVEQVRIAQGSIAQAGALAAQVSTARERLATATTDLGAAIASISSDLVDARRLADQVPSAVLAPLVADAEAAVAEGRGVSASNGNGGDPLAALEHLARAEGALDAALASARAKEENDARARSQLSFRLSHLTSQVEAVTSYVTTHRGVVGASARTALSEASRHAAAAARLQVTDAAAALAEVAAAEPLVAQAQALAEADVRNHHDSWGSGSGSGGSGIDLGSLILGGILLGGGGHRGGYGGWGGHSGGFGGFGGGGFGGGGFGGGGGGFGGGGGRF